MKIIFNLLTITGFIAKIFKTDLLYTLKETFLYYKLIMGIRVDKKVYIIPLLTRLKPHTHSGGAKGVRRRHLYRGGNRGADIYLALRGNTPCSANARAHARTHTHTHTHIIAVAPKY